MKFHLAHDAQSRSYSAFARFGFLARSGLINSHNANYRSSLKPCAINYCQAFFFIKSNGWIFGKEESKDAHLIEVNPQIYLIREIHFSDYSSLDKILKSVISHSQKKLSPYPLVGVENGS